MRKRLMVLVVMASLGLATPAAAATIHVDQQGLAGQCSDARNRDQAGSPLSPLCTVTRGAQVAQAGDVVDVRAGSYDYLTLTGRDMAARTTIRAHLGEQPRLAGFNIDSSDRWRIEGFRSGDRNSLVQNGTLGAQVVGNEFSPWGVTVKHSADALIERNYCHDTAITGTRTESEGYCFRFTRNASGTRVVRPVVRGNLAERVHADFAQFGSTDDPVVEGNVARDIRDISNVGEHNDFVQCYPGCPGLNLINNDVDGAHQGCMCGDSNGSPSPRVVIAGNRFANVRQIVLNVYDMPGVRIENNTIWGFGASERRPLRLRDPNAPITGALIRGNIFRDNVANEAGADAITQEDYNLFPTRTSGKVYGPHDTFGTPTFSGSHGLAANSLGVDAGWRNGGAVDDASVANRGGPDGSGYGDVGWRERGAAASPEPAPGPTPAPSATPEATPAPPPDAAADARWTHAPAGPRIGEVVRLDGTGSTGDGPLACRWEFTDSAGRTIYQTRDGCAIDFTFAGAGTKWIRLVVTDADGDRDTDLHSLTVSP